MFRESFCLSGRCVQKLQSFEAIPPICQKDPRGRWKAYVLIIGKRLPKGNFARFHIRNLFFFFPRYEIKLAGFSFFGSAEQVALHTDWSRRKKTPFWVSFSNGGEENFLYPEWVCMLFVCSCACLCAKCRRSFSQQAQCMLLGIKVGPATLLGDHRRLGGVKRAWPYREGWAVDVS